MNLLSFLTVLFLYFICFVRRVAKALCCDRSKKHPNRTDDGRVRLDSTCSLYINIIQIGLHKLYRGFSLNKSIMTTKLHHNTTTQKPFHENQRQPSHKNIAQTHSTSQLSLASGYISRYVSLQPLKINAVNLNNCRSR